MADRLAIYNVTALVEAGADAAEPAPVPAPAAGAGAQAGGGAGQGPGRLVPLPDACVCVQDGKVTLVRGGLESEEAARAAAGQADLLDGEGGILMAGLVNAHTHASMTLLRGYADDLPLMRWLSEEIWPAEEGLTAGDVYRGALLACVEMLKGGVTCFADMYFFMDEVARAVEESGVRASLATGLIGTGKAPSLALDLGTRFCEKWRGGAGGRITTMMGPHAPYTCPPGYLREVMARARDLGVGVHIHVAETAGEREDCLRDYGKTPVGHLDSVGVFELRTLAAHCVHVDGEDIQVLAARGVGVAHCPGSNMKIACGMAPLVRMMRAGVNVGLGTDGAASNNNLDVMEEVRLAALAHKDHSGDPETLPAGQALWLATRGGALALGLDDVGLVAPGFKADLVLLDTGAPHLVPMHNAVSQVVYAARATDVRTVLVGGKLVVKDRQVLTVNERECMDAAAASAGDLVRKASTRRKEGGRSG